MNELNLGLGSFPFVFPLKFLKVYWKNSKEQRNIDKDVCCYVRACVCVRTCALLHIHNSEHLTTSMLNAHQ